MAPEGEALRAMHAGDTIVALSSPAGASARAIIRASGPAALPLAQGVAPVDDLDAGATRSTLNFRDLSVPVWLYVFRAPRSYTGEDMVEFHIPGNPVLVKGLLDELLARGARQAEPGEFTARAYFNGRIDLTEAEGVAAAIAAHGQQELAAARQLLSGELSRRLAPAMDLLADTLALVEVGIDFSEEDVSLLPRDQFLDRLNRIEGMLNRLLSESARFEQLSHEPTVVLVGRPNAGKSTLLNALACTERSVVSPVAGTTRDVLSAEVALARGIVRVLDVAGLDDHPASADEIERQMRSRAVAAVGSADIVVLVIEGSDDRPPLALPREPDFVIRSKSDVGRASPATLADAAGDARPTLSLSALTGHEMDRLREHLDAVCFGSAAGGSALALNVRHVRAVTDARSALARAAAPPGGPELVAADLRDALDSLGSVLGRVSPDDLLGRIFSGFCIGK